MGLMNFFKRLKEKNRTEESEKVAFDKIGDWMENKRKEIEDPEKKIFGLIQEKVNSFINELKKKVNILESVDLGPKKAEDKIKSIVNEARKKYIEKVKDFSESLSILEKNKLEKFISDVNKLFHDFSKSSHTSYEKTTILIGKEAANIKKDIIEFSKYLTKIFDENKAIVDSSKIISLIELKLKQIIEVEEVIKENGESITSLDKKITKKKQEDKEIIEEIEEIKKGKSYVENLRKQEEIKLWKVELEKDIFSLRQLIDFKALANFFHIFEEPMSIVKAHKKDFQKNFQEDDGKSILNLLEEAKLNNETISTKIKQINDKKKEIIRTTESIKKDETEDSLINAKAIKLEIESLDDEKEREKKRGEKLKVNKEEIINSIKQELTKINVVLFDV